MRTRSRRKSRCQSTFHYVLLGLDVAALEKALARWVRAAGSRSALQIAIDGKELRGSKSGQYPGLRILCAYSEGLKGVVEQMKVPGQDNEIVAGQSILKQLPLRGAVVTGDAIYAQKRICNEISRRGGNYSYVVKDSQSELKRDIQESFDFFSPRTSQASRI